MSYQESKLNILIIGSGAVGGLFGYRCSQSKKAYVTMVCRSNYNQVKLNGFQIDSCTWGYDRFYPDQVLSCDDPTNKNNINYDFVFITTKSKKSNAMPQFIKPFISSNSCITLIQNGVEIEPVYTKAFPDNSLISVITFVGVHQSSPGYLKHLMPFKMYFGNGRYHLKDHLPQDLDHINALESIVNNSGIDYTISDKMRMIRWHKLQCNATVAMYTILTGGKTLQNVLNHSITKQLVLDGCQEISSLAEKLIGESFPSWLQTMEEHIEQVTTKLLPYKPSVLIDYEKGLPLELDTTLGELIHIADSLNYPVPISKTIYALLTVADINNRARKLTHQYCINI